MKEFKISDLHPDKYRKELDAVCKGLPYGTEEFRTGSDWLYDQFVLPNFSLIAAAPELLKALIKIQKLIKHHVHQIEDENQNKWRIIEASEIEALITPEITRALEE